MEGSVVAPAGGVNPAGVDIGKAGAPYGYRIGGTYVDCPVEYCTAV